MAQKKKRKRAKRGTRSSSNWRENGNPPHARRARCSPAGYRQPEGFSSGASGGIDAGSIQPIAALRSLFNIDLKFKSSEGDT